MKERSAAIKELTEKNIASVSSALDNNIELNQFGCDKGDGLKHLAKCLGLTMDEVMACGDAGNDTMMIKAAGTGVVMGNGREELKAIGDKDRLERLFNELVFKDWFMTLLDLKDYIKVKDQVFADYEDRNSWAKKMLVNIGEAGFFSSDRTIKDYAENIWNIQAVTVD